MTRHGRDPSVKRIYRGCTLTLGLDESGRVIHCDRPKWHNGPCSTIEQRRAAGAGKVPVTEVLPAGDGTTRAQYPGFCHMGQHPIRVGDAIVKVFGGWQHEHCDDAQTALELGPREVVCHECFMVKPCPCDDE